MTEHAAKLTTDLLPTDKPRSPWDSAWREFRRNRLAVIGGFVVIGTILIALLAPLITPYHFADQNTRNNRAYPMDGYVISESQASRCHWRDTFFEWGCTVFVAGSDALGRDLYSRMIYGTRVSLSVAIVASGVSLIAGIIIGTISGFFGGTIDNMIMRVVDFLYAIPLLPIIILMQVYFQALARQGVTEGFAGTLIKANQNMGGLLFLFVAIGMLNWIGMARLARGQILTYKNKEFVEAAEAVGASQTRIIFKHLLPNIFGPLLIAESLAIPGYIFTEAILSFIGLGVNPPIPSWGSMINDGYQGIRSAAHLVLVPGVALTALTLAFNFVGDGLRDAFDPRMRGRR
jgi:ABC-type dipeptide/oligopeptide/nickel transport system permease subunit